MADPDAVTPGRPPLCSQPSCPTDGLLFREALYPLTVVLPCVVSDDHCMLVDGGSTSSSSQRCCLRWAPCTGLLAAGFPHASCGGAKEGCHLFPISRRSCNTLCHMDTGASALCWDAPLKSGVGGKRGLTWSEPSFYSWRHSGREVGQGDRHVKWLSKSTVIYPSP